MDLVDRRRDTLLLSGLLERGDGATTEFGVVSDDGGVGDRDRLRITEKDLWWTGDIGGLTLTSLGNIVPILEGPGMGDGGARTGSTLTAWAEQISRSSFDTSGTAVDSTKDSTMSVTEQSFPPSTCRTYSSSNFTFLHLLNFLSNLA